MTFLEIRGMGLGKQNLPREVSKVGKMNTEFKGTRKIRTIQILTSEIIESLTDSTISLIGWGSRKRLEELKGIRRTRATKLQVHSTQKNRSQRHLIPHMVTEARMIMGKWMMTSQNIQDPRRV